MNNAHQEEQQEAYEAEWECFWLEFSRDFPPKHKTDEVKAIALYCFCEGAKRNALFVKRILSRE